MVHQRMKPKSLLGSAESPHQYGSIPQSLTNLKQKEEEEGLLLLESTRGSGGEGFSHVSSRRRGGGRCCRTSTSGISCFVAGFGLAILVVVVGAILWISTNLSRASSGLERHYDYNNDDDRYDHGSQQMRSPYSSSSSSWWKEMITTLPIMGESRVHATYKAQQQANRNRDYLYWDPHHKKILEEEGQPNNSDEEEEEQKHHKKKHKKKKSKGKKHTETVDPTTATTSTNHVEAQDGCEATVMLMRHCDKGNKVHPIREHCSYLGYERAVYLSTLFGGNTTTTTTHRWPEPSYLIAEMPSHRRNPTKRNYREVETLLPLANKFHLPIDTNYSTLETKELAQKVQGMLRSGEMCGKLIVVAWMHSKIPKLAFNLGCGPEDGCPLHYRGRDFDVVWQLKFVFGKPWHSTHKSLRPPKHKRWLIYGSVQNEGFDPLAFSAQMGDYPSGGTPTGGRWRHLDNEIPERDLTTTKDPHHHDDEDGGDHESSSQDDDDDDDDDDDSN